MFTSIFLAVNTLRNLSSKEVRVRFQKCHFFREHRPHSACLFYLDSAAVTISNLPFSGAALKAHALGWNSAVTQFTAPSQRVWLDPLSKSPVAHQKHGDTQTSSKAADELTPFHNSMKYFQKTSKKKTATL